MASETNWPAWKTRRDGSRMVKIRSTTPSPTTLRDDNVAVKGPAFIAGDTADIASNSTRGAFVSGREECFRHPRRLVLVSRDAKSASLWPNGRAGSLSRSWRRLGVQQERWGSEGFGAGSQR